MRLHTEVLEILRFVPKESIDKIPKEMINAFIKKVRIDKIIKNCFCKIYYTLIVDE